MYLSKERLVYLLGCHLYVSVTLSILVSPSFSRLFLNYHSSPCSLFLSPSFCVSFSVSLLACLCPCRMYPFMSPILCLCVSLSFDCQPLMSASPVFSLSASVAVWAVIAVIMPYRHNLSLYRQRSLLGFLRKVTQWQLNVCEFWNTDSLAVWCGWVWLGWRVLKFPPDPFSCAPAYCRQIDWDSWLWWRTDAANENNTFIPMGYYYYFYHY